jgi:HTH-type transcriptional regulator/antitoxin HigA
MNTRQSDDCWENFTHTTRTETVKALELLERYQVFRKFVMGLSKKELVKRGWLRSPDDFSSLAPIFFDLPIASHPTLFRKSSGADETLLAMWLARARAHAEYVCVAEERQAFTELTKADLRKLARLSVDPKVVRDLPNILAVYGIILVYVLALPGMKADGAVFRLSSGHPVVALSLRFPRLDYFWFTLMHELAHLVLHAEELRAPVFFDVEGEEKDVVEKAANRLAKDSFVERSSWRSCEPKYDTGKEALLRYAEQESVHPSIIAGLLRRESGNYTRYSAIINKHDVRQVIFSP